MKLSKISSKKAAIELSIGTVVIIVLAMTMLILGILLIRTIFVTTTDSVKQVDQGVKNEISKLFSENQDKKLILYPDSKLIKLEQGSQDSGFVISIRNLEQTDKQYTYQVVPGSQGSCLNAPITPTGSVRIITGQQETVTIPASSIMQNPRHVRLSVSDTAPACTFSLIVNVYTGAGPTGTVYESDRMDVEITPK